MVPRETSRDATKAALPLRDNCAAFARVLTDGVRAC